MDTTEVDREAHYAADTPGAFWWTWRNNILSMWGDSDLRYMATFRFEDFVRGGFRGMKLIGHYEDDEISLDLTFFDVVCFQMPEGASLHPGHMAASPGWNGDFITRPFQWAFSSEIIDVDRQNFIMTDLLLASKDAFMVTFCGQTSSNQAYDFVVYDEVKGMQMNAAVTRKAGIWTGIDYERLFINGTQDDSEVPFLEVRIFGQGVVATGGAAGDAGGIVKALQDLAKMDRTVEINHGGHVFHVGSGELSDE